jgi:glycosyltransferase involved in cell wall biosynthesis
MTGTAPMAARLNNHADVDFDTSVIIPANNEERYIGACLGALLGQDDAAGRLQIIVAANACTDRTEEIVESFAGQARRRGWELICQGDPRPGKADALNRADQLADAAIRVYLDADIVCDSDMFGKLRAALSGAEPAYASGRIVVAPARSWVTRAYGRVWSLLPFVKDGATGAGLFAVNAAGRRRWNIFPAIIADDTYVRLSFTPSERIEVSSSYTWPMVEGLRNLVRVRRRQDAGVEEVYKYYPTLRPNEAKRPVGGAELVRIALREPIGFVVYALVRLLVRLQPTETGWSRGR